MLLCNSQCVTMALNKSHLQPNGNNVVQFFFFFRSEMKKNVVILLKFNLWWIRFCAQRLTRTATVTWKKYIYISSRWNLMTLHMLRYRLVHYSHNKERQTTRAIFHKPATRVHKSKMCHHAVIWKKYM